MKFISSLSFSLAVLVALTMRLFLLFVLCLVSTEAQAGLWPFGKKKPEEASEAAAPPATDADLRAHACASPTGLGGLWSKAVSGAKEAALAAQRKLEAGLAVKQLSQSIVSVASSAHEVVRQIESLACSAGKMGWSFAITLPVSSLKAAWRVWRFNPDKEGVKTGLVIPLIHHLRLIRELRDQPNSEAALAKEMAEFLIFLIEATLKAQKIAIDLAAEKVGGLGSLALGAAAAAAGMPGEPSSDSSLGGELTKKFLKEFLKSAWLAMTTKGLSLKERLDLLRDTETHLTLALAQLIQEMGWPDLEKEIQNWKPKEEEPEASATESESAASDSKAPIEG